MKSSEIKIFVAILVGAIVLVGFAMAPMLLTARRPGDGPFVVRHPKSMFLGAGAHTRGNPNAPITIVEFSDFQCPSCREGIGLMKQINVKKPGQIFEVFHHFQVRPEHVYARVLSRGAEAAGEQGEENFWKMHDLLFDKQKEITELTSEDQVVNRIRGLAKELKLDMIKFDASMLKKTADAQFEKDNRLGEQVHVPGTPTYFVYEPNNPAKQYNSNAALEKWAVAKDDPTKR